MLTNHQTDVCSPFAEGLAAPCANLISYRDPFIIAAVQGEIMIPQLSTTASGQLLINQPYAIDEATRNARAAIDAQNKIAAIGMWASTQTALMKLKTDLNDAMNSFIKGVGSSVKSAAQ
jgi:hypothetical protein